MMATPTAYVEAVDRVSDVLAFHARGPAFLVRSPELEARVRAAARAALLTAVPLDALRADLARLAAVTLTTDASAVLATGRAMARWAAREFDEAAGRAPLARPG
jgi:hypothetical protein